MKPHPFAILLAVCLVINAGITYPVWADTDGPSGYTPVNPNCPNDKNGPCTDPHQYTGNGIGNGLCGRCGNIVWTYTGGTCQGTDPGPPNCFECSYAQTITDFYVSTPVGALMFAVCCAATAAMLVADGVCFILCGGVCLTAGVWTGGTACWLCLAGCGAGGVAIICFYDECVEDCDYVNTGRAGTATGCW